MLSFVGTGPRADYEFEISGGDLAKSTANEANHNDQDKISGTTASGYVYSAADSCVFSGDLTSISLNGDAEVYYNGQRVTEVLL